MVQTMGTAQDRENKSMICKIEKTAKRGRGSLGHVFWAQAKKRNGRVLKKKHVQ